MSTTSATTHQLLVERLRARRAELEARLSKVTADRQKARGPLDPDFEEQAVERENDEVLDALDTAERKELSEISLALGRIDAGCFGICDDCGGRIPLTRLRALPGTTRCTACAARG